VGGGKIVTIVQKKNWGGGKKDLEGVSRGNKSGGGGVKGRQLKKLSMGFYISQAKFDKIGGGEGGLEKKVGGVRLYLG